MRRASAWEGSLEGDQLYKGKCLQQNYAGMLYQIYFPDTTIGKLQIVDMKIYIKIGLAVAGKL